MRINVSKMTKMAVLAALSFVLMLLVRFPILPAAPFLEYEPADVPILIGTFLFGPLEGLLLTVVVSLIQALTVSAGSGWVGFVMHVIATGAFAMAAGLIYKRFHTFIGALIALIVGTICMTAVMIPSNLFFTVKFWGYPYETVRDMLIPVFIPFNLIKAGLNSVLTIGLYKALGKVLKGLGSKISPVEK